MSAVLKIETCSLHVSQQCSVQPATVCRNVQYSHITLTLCHQKQVAALISMSLRSIRCISIYQFTGHVCDVIFGVSLQRPCLWRHRSYVTVSLAPRPRIVRSWPKANQIVTKIGQICDFFQIRFLVHFGSAAWCTSVCTYLYCTSIVLYVCLWCTFVCSRTAVNVSVCIIFAWSLNYNLPLSGYACVC